MVTIAATPCPRIARTSTRASPATARKGTSSKPTPVSLCASNLASTAPALPLASALVTSPGRESAASWPASAMVTATVPDQSLLQPAYSARTTRWGTSASTASQAMLGTPARREGGVSPVRLFATATPPTASPGKPSPPSKTPRDSSLTFHQKPPRRNGQLVWIFSLSWRG